MNYVYILQSVRDPDQFYTGHSKDVAARLSSHNAGQSRTRPNSNLGGSCLFIISSARKLGRHLSAISRAGRVARSQTNGFAESRPDAPPCLGIT